MNKCKRKAAKRSRKNNATRQVRKLRSVVKSNCRDLGITPPKTFTFQECIRVEQEFTRVTSWNYRYMYNDLGCHTQHGRRFRR